MNRRQPGALSQCAQTRSIFEQSHYGPNNIVRRHALFGDKTQDSQQVRSYPCYLRILASGTMTN